MTGGSTGSVSGGVVGSVTGGVVGLVTGGVTGGFVTGGFGTGGLGVYVPPSLPPPQAANDIAKTIEAEILLRLFIVFLVS